MAKTSAPRSPRTPAAASLDEQLAAIVEPKKLPSILVPADLPPLVRAGGEPLDPALLVAVLRAVASGSLEGALGTRLREALTRESADAFARRLLELWGTREFHGRYEFILGTIGALGGDRTAIALEPLINVRSGCSDAERRRAVAALPVLRRIGTDAALLVLMGLRHKAVVPSVLEAAIGALAGVSADRGLGLSELADRITPTLGLDARGIRTLSYGPRAFTLALDEHFEPRVRDGEGTLLTELPRPAAEDDPARAEAAMLTWSALSAELREAVKVQSFRLEQDMIGGRRWDVETWTRCLQRHPLMVSFTRRLLWGVYGEEDALVTGFRSAEDQTLVDLEDAALRLPAGARIGVVHPLHLDEAGRRAWAENFADYEIISPFPQLQRAVILPGEHERAAVAATCSAADRCEPGAAGDTLVRRGWERDPRHARRFYQRTFARDGVMATAHLDPASPTVAFKKWGAKRASSKPLPLGEVPVVAFSEALLDIQESLVEQDG